MNTSAAAIPVTHTGSLRRPAGLQDTSDGEAVRAAVAQMVARQLQAGVTRVSDGEMSRPSYVTYVTGRLTGLTGPPRPSPLRGFDHYPAWAQRHFGDMEQARLFTNPSCAGPVAYRGGDQIQRDISNLLAAAGDAPGAFLTSASPGVIELFMPNGYYPSAEEYLWALAEAMKAEYNAIHAAGLGVQLDCPDLAMLWMMAPQLTRDEFRREVARRVEIINWATAGIPPDRLRIHVCWGNFAAPHDWDAPLAWFLDLLLAARAGSLAIEAASPRHAHEWVLFEDAKLRDDQQIIAGVIDTSTEYVEHPDLVAQRLVNFAGCVGAGRVIAGTGCGFGTFAAYTPIDAAICWAKLAALAEGARIASRRLAPAA